LPSTNGSSARLSKLLAKLEQGIRRISFRRDGRYAIYQFVWGTFCDWYLELIKPVLSPLPHAGGAGGGLEDGEVERAPTASPTPNPSRMREGDEAQETRAVAGWVIDQILVMLHPFMPFITEELWHAMGARNYDLIVAKWPEPKAKLDLAAGAEINWLIQLVSEVRSAKNELGIAPGRAAQRLCARCRARNAGAGSSGRRGRSPGRRGSTASRMPRRRRAARCRSWWMRRRS
jgi:valyl-tRNA synthetase